MRSRIRTERTVPRIRDTSVSGPRIEPVEVASALGAATLAGVASLATHVPRVMLALAMRSVIGDGKGPNARS